MVRKQGVPATGYGLETERAASVGDALAFSSQFGMKRTLLRPANRARDQQQQPDLPPHAHAQENHLWLFFVVLAFRTTFRLDVRLLFFLLFTARFRFCGSAAAAISSPRLLRRFVASAWALWTASVTSRMYSAAAPSCWMACV